MNQYEFLIEEYGTKSVFVNKFIIKYRSIKSNNPIKRLFNIKDKWKILTKTNIALTPPLRNYPLIFNRFIDAIKKIDEYVKKPNELEDFIIQEDAKYSAMLLKFK